MVPLLTARCFAQRRLQRPQGQGQGHHAVVDADTVADFWSGVGAVGAAGRADGGSSSSSSSSSHNSSSSSSSGLLFLLDPLPFLVNGPSAASVPAHAREAWRHEHPDLAGLVEGQEQDVALRTIDRLLWGLVGGNDSDSDSNHGDNDDDDAAAAAAGDSTTGDSSTAIGGGAGADDGGSGAIAGGDEKGRRQGLPRKYAGRPPSFVRELLLRWA